MLLMYYCSTVCAEYSVITLKPLIYIYIYIYTQYIYYILGVGRFDFFTVRITVLVLLG